VAGCEKGLSSPKQHNITCYVATYGEGIYKSDNGGTSWFPLDFDQKPLHAYFKRVYPSPDDRDVLFVTTSGAGLFEFNLQTGPLERVEWFRGKNVTSVAFPDIVPGLEVRAEMLVGMNGGGVLKAQVGSETWEPSNEGLTFRDVNVLFAHGKDLYAGTVKDLFKLGGSSKQWVPASRGIKNKNILSMADDPEGKTLFAGSGGYEGPGLYKSSDQGLTWMESCKGIPDGTLIYAIGVNPKRPERMYLGTSDGVYRSTNGGRNWYKMTRGLPKDARIYDIRVARMADGADVVYAVGSNGVFMATDADNTTWASRSYGLPRTAITSILICP